MSEAAQSLDGREPPLWSPPAGAIVRLWHGAVPAAMEADYLRLMNSVALPDYRSAPGNLAAFALHRRDGDTSHILMVTFWESEAAIRGFAGADIDAARYYDFDDRFLIEKEATVTHYRVGPGGTGT